MTLISKYAKNKIFAKVEENKNKDEEKTYLVTELNMDELKAQAVLFGFKSNWNSSIGVLANNNRDNSDVAAVGLSYKLKIVEAFCKKGNGSVAYVPLDRKEVIVDGKTVGRTVKINKSILSKMEVMYKNLDVSTVTEDNIELFFEDYDIFIDAGGQFRIDAAKKNYQPPAEFIFEGVDSGLNKKLDIVLENEYNFFSEKKKNEYIKSENAEIFFTTSLFEHEPSDLKTLEKGEKISGIGPVMAARQQKAYALIELTETALEIIETSADMSNEEYEILSVIVQEKTGEDTSLVEYNKNMYSIFWQLMMSVENMEVASFIKSAKENGKYIDDDDIESVRKSVTEKGVINTAVANVARIAYLSKGTTPTMAGALMLQLVKGRLFGSTEKLKSKESKFLTSAFSEEFQLVSATIMDLIGQENYHSEEYYFQILAEPGETLPESIISDGVKIVSNEGVVMKSTLSTSAPKGISLELKTLKSGTQYYSIPFKEGLEYRIVNAPKEEVAFQVELECYDEFEKEFDGDSAISIEFHGGLKDQISYINDMIDVSKEMKYYFLSKDSSLFIVANKDDKWEVVCKLKNGYGRDKGIPSPVLKAMDKKELKNLRFKVGAPYKSAIAAVFAELTGESIPEGIDVTLSDGKTKANSKQDSIKQSATVEQFKALLSQNKTDKTKGVKLQLLKSLPETEEDNNSTSEEIVQEVEEEVAAEKTTEAVEEVAEETVPAKKSFLDKFAPKKGVKGSILKSIKNAEASKMAEEVMKVMQEAEDGQAAQEEVKKLTSKEKAEKMFKISQEAVDEFNA